jgi:hypothetical protein
MTKREVIDRIEPYREELRAQGVKSLALFGSVAREEAGQASDVDIVVQLDRPLGLFGLSDLKHSIERILGVSNVDLMTRDGIHPALKEAILEEIVDVI